MSTYILQKDLPKSKVGTEFNDDETNVYLPANKKRWEVDKDECLLKSTVENNNEWFKLKEETKIQIKDIHFLEYSDNLTTYTFDCTGRIPNERFNDLRTCMEFLINNSLDNIFKGKQKWTDEDMKNAIVSALSNCMNPQMLEIKWAEDYINSLNK